MLNKIFIMGRLTRDPELRRTQSGTAVTSFSLAVDRDYKSQSGEKETDFIDVVAWRSTGGAMWSMPPMKFLTQNTEMCWIAGSITAIRTDFCNIRQKRHWKTGCPIMGHFGPSGAICATVPK